MRKILLLLISFLLFSSSFAADSEEDACIQKLNDLIRSDNRFNDPSVFKNDDGLDKVLYFENNNSTIDISTYDKFQDYLVVNPVSTDEYHQNLIENNGFTENDFLARRTNIATTIADNNFVISNVVGFGRDSNFNFPLPAESGNSYGDEYKLKGIKFREYVLYTHHSYTGEFLSCGIVHVKPLGDRTYTNIDETGYYSNVLNGDSCASGFEGSDTSKDGYDFYKMKTNVCVIDYEEKDYLKMEVISLAYDNNSDYFSDYVAHKLQVEAMKDLDNQEKGLNGIRDIFERYLFDGTCMSLIHKTIADLPSFCNGNYSDYYDLSNIDISDINAAEVVFDSNIDYFAYIYNFLLPEVNAVRDLKNMDTLVEEARGMVAVDNMPYELYKKLQSIEDDNFRNYLTLSISPNLEDLIQYRRNNGFVITPYEDIFLQCNISYSERNDIVINFLENLEDPKNIDFSNLVYSNPRFGNCIVPYPDRRFIDKEIKLSFSSNKLLAQKIKGNYEAPEVNELMVKLAEEQRKLASEYEIKINTLTKKFNSNELTGEELNKLLVEERNIYEQKVQKISEELTNIKEEKIEQISDEINEELKNIDETNIKIDKITIIIIALLITVGALIVFVSIKRRKK